MLQDPQNHLPASSLPRPRLHAVLDTAFLRPFVVVNAGAGFGKTTAVSQYLAQTQRRVVWFLCTEPDNIPARFWEHLTQVFAHHRPKLGEQMRALGFPESLQAFAGFLANLTDELYHDEREVSFVFDDFHLITDPGVQAFLLHLIGARLENSSIVLLTRHWPIFGQQPPVAPQLVGADDLRFTQQETQAYLMAAGLQADDETIARVHHYVAGWPIALSLVALSLQHGAPASFANNPLATTKPALYALFQQEIFSQYTPAEQDLLVKLSVLDSFPRGLVQAVTGEQGRDLPQLLGGNSFIRYDADAMRLSFHPLYQEFLREKLQSIPQAARNAAYQKAAEWCRDNGHYYDAANYYKQCGQHEALWDTLLRIPAVRHTKSEADFFIEQIEQLPPAFRTTHPMTDIVLAALYLNNLRPAQAAQTLDDVLARLEAAPKTPEVQALLGEAHTARGLLLLGMKQNGFDMQFEKANALLPDGSSRWNAGLQLIDLGPGMDLQSAKAGELKKSLACFTRAAPHMVRVLHGAGQGLDKLCECEALFLTGEAKRATEPGYQALYAAQAASQFDIVGNALFMLLRCYTVLGDYTQILDTLEHVQRYEEDPASQKLGIWDIIRGWFAAEMNQVEQVALWIRNPVQKGFAPISIDRAVLLRLRCLIAAGQYAEAFALLDQFEALAAGKGAVVATLYAAIGRAVAHNYMGRHGDATDALKTAYSLAKGNGLVMPFIEYGHRTRALLERARQTSGHGIPAEWLDDVFAKASTYAKRHAYLLGRYRQRQQDHQTDYGLSRRETELLANLSQGLTREEMAEAMELSINTIKSMTKQVFAKLGAINAADAVRIAIVNQLI